MKTLKLNKTLKLLIRNYKKIIKLNLGYYKLKLNRTYIVIFKTNKQKKTTYKILIQNSNNSAYIIQFKVNLNCWNITKSNILNVNWFAIDFNQLNYIKYIFKKMTYIYVTKLTWLHSFIIKWLLSLGHQADGRPSVSICPVSLVRSTRRLSSGSRRQKFARLNMLNRHRGLRREWELWLDVQFSEQVSSWELNESDENEHVNEGGTDRRLF